MIRLEVKDYCQKCNHFKIAVDEPEKIEGNFGEIEYYGDYIIRCKYRGNMQRFIKNY